MNKKSPQEQAIDHLLLLDDYRRELKWRIDYLRRKIKENAKGYKK